MIIYWKWSLCYDIIGYKFYCINVLDYKMITDSWHLIIIIMYFILISNLMYEFTYQADGSSLVSNILQSDVRDGF